MPPGPKPHVLHIISGLGQGGAEAVLCRLVERSMDRVCHSVLSLGDEGVYGPRLRRAGVDVKALNLSLLHPGSALRDLRSGFRESPLDLVQTWMYHADLVGGFAARCWSAAPVVWGVRSADLAASRVSWRLRVLAKWAAWLSNIIPAAIVYCSEKGRAYHEALGYNRRRSRFIPNGFDTELFVPNPEIRQRLRVAWGIHDDLPVLGMLARWDAAKDHANLLAALSCLRRSGVRFHLVLAGPGMTTDNRELASSIAAYAAGPVHLLGAQSRPQEFFAALDVHLLSSAEEAFPNVIGEAMACAVPCVSTDVGDARALIGDCGWLAPPRDPEAFATAVAQALALLESEGLHRIGQSARRRVVERYGLDKMVDAYCQLWEEQRRKRDGECVDW
jgi:glycosyltransferase involved in cell wall biosynthesis